MEVKLNTALRFVALVVPELRSAEDYYQFIFNMELIGCEALLPDGMWYTLPFDKDWADAEAARTELGMTALQKDRFVLALFRGDASPGQVLVIGVEMPKKEMARVQTQLQRRGKDHERALDRLEFRDPYQIVWQISLPGEKFRTAGDWANRWLKL
jgi:hypothetical protein